MQNILNSVEALNAELATRPVSAVYSGRPGCACGCNGEHSSQPAEVERVISAMRDLVSTGGGAVEIMVMPGTFVSVETSRRLYIAYTDGRDS